MTANKDYLAEKLRLLERAKEDIYFRQVNRELLDAARRQREETTPTSEELEDMQRVYHKILVPVDFSNDAAEALLHAASLAARGDVSLIVLHVISRDLHYHETRQRLERQAVASAPLSEQDAADISPEVMEASGDGLRERSYAALHHFLPAPFAALPVELRVVIGHPVERIVEMAVQECVDLIVMGTHGHTGPNEAMIGDVSERVTRVSPCSVLLVKTPATHEAGWLERFYEDFMIPTRPY